MLSFRQTTPEDQAGLKEFLLHVWNGDEGAVAYHGNGRSRGWLAQNDGQVVGYAHVGRGSLHRTHTYFGVHVLPEYRHQGIASRLWNLAEVGDIKSPKTATYASMPDTVRFLERRGLRVSVETHMPLLTPPDLNEAAVNRWVNEVASLGFELLPMTALSGPDVRRSLTRLHLDVYAHTHEHDPPTEKTEEEAQGDFMGDDLVPEWLFVARQDGVLAGVSSVRLDEPLPMLGWFGVAKAFAAVGAPLTLALTGLAVQAAGRDGVTELTAELDSPDPNAMHLLHALPWRTERVWLTFTRAMLDG